MQRAQIQKIIKDINAMPLDVFQSKYPQYFEDLKLKPLDFVRELVAFVQDNPGVSLGMSDADWIDLAKKLGQKALRRAVYAKLPPALQRQHQELNEVTTTANIATYPVPIGARMLRRKWPTVKKSGLLP